MRPEGPRGGPYARPGKRLRLPNAALSFLKLFPARFLKKSAPGVAMSAYGVPLRDAVVAHCEKGGRRGLGPQ